MDKNTNSIYKGIESIKFLNNQVANELYELRNNNYNTFIDLLYNLKNTSINSRQLNILVQLDFFSQYGNCKELLSIVSVFYEDFKQGDIKSFKKDKISSDFLYKTIAQYANDKGKNNKELKSFVIPDCYPILIECEKHIKSLNMSDLDLRTKIKNQMEFLGYISASQKEEERNILLVKEIYPLFRKRDQVMFGQSVITISIGSGVQSRFTIFNKNYEECGQLQKNDIIRCLSYKRDDKGYFKMEKYEIML